MAKVSRVSKIQEEIARLQERLEEERSKEAERLGSIAVKAGLADSDRSTYMQHTEIRCCVAQCISCPQADGQHLGNILDPIDKRALLR